MRVDDRRLIDHPLDPPGQAGHMGGRRGLVAVGESRLGVNRAIAEPTHATVEVIMNRPRRDVNAARAGVR